MNGEDLFIEPIEANVNHSQPNEHMITKRSIDSHLHINHMSDIKDFEKLCGIKGLVINKIFEFH